MKLHKVLQKAAMQENGLYTISLFIHQTQSACWNLEDLNLVLNHKSFINDMDNALLNEVGVFIQRCCNSDTGIFSAADIVTLLDEKCCGVVEEAKIVVRGECDKSLLTTIEGIANDRCYIVGSWSDDREDKVWAVQGVYDDEVVAQLACTGPLWFVMPTEKNTPLPLTREVVGYYPNTIK